MSGVKGKVKYTFEDAKTLFDNADLVLYTEDSLLCFKTRKGGEVNANVCPFTQGFKWER